MAINDFINSYNNEYIVTFHNEKKESKSALTKISEFLFVPRYQVNNLKFKTVS